ncbi:MAG: hypothetical protein ACOH1J_06780 [Microbacteriaceae bacterium]
MSISSRTSTVLFSALALIALTGCAAGPSTGGTDGEGTDGENTSESSGGEGLTLVECVAGHTWSADVDDMANQLFEQMSSASGMAVSSVTAEGSQLMKWKADNSVSIETDYVFTVTANLDDGLVMTMVQSHKGPSQGALTVSGSTATPTGWDNSAYTITTDVDINGMSSEMATDLPATGIDDGSSLTISCSGDEMTTVAEGGLFSQSWTRID